jgi:primosomal protein N' (replication factor Y) (superfamily II helicase)
VIVQTALPTHYAITFAAEHDFLAFAERELAERTNPRYPPHTRLVNLVFSGLEEEATRVLAERAARWLARAAEQRRSPAWRSSAPPHVPSTGSGRAGAGTCSCARIPWARAGERRAILRGAVPVPAGKHDLRVAIDRDPVALL